MVQFIQCGFRILFYSDIRMMESLPSGYPIRLSRDHRICAPSPGFSQLITAFFASQLQGIPHTPIVRLTILSFLLISPLALQVSPSGFKRTPLVKRAEQAFRMRPFRFMSHIYFRSAFRLSTFAVLRIPSLVLSNIACGSTTRRFAFSCTALSTVP